MTDRDLACHAAQDVPGERQRAIQGNQDQDVKQVDGDERSDEANKDQGFRGRGNLQIGHRRALPNRTEEHTSELQSIMRISYAVFCLKNNKTAPYIQKTDKRIHK